MIPLAVPNLTGNEKKYLDNCIDTTFVSSVGEYVNKFEEMVAEATGVDTAVATSSGTTGLHIALKAVGVDHGDIVIIPSFTFIASANAIRHCGADPWLMDINEETWCLDPMLVKNEIDARCEFRDGKLIHKDSRRRIAAIMPVYTLGNIPDMDSFKFIADTYKIPLVVDAACAIGAEYNGEKLGKLADLSVLSFNGNKTVTCGGGGAVVGNDQALLDKIRHLTTTARVWPDYEFDVVGYNYRMTNVQAALGVAQMERLDSFVERKRYIRDFYASNLKGLEYSGVSFFPTTEGSSCWFSGIVLPEEAVLDDAKRICFVLKEQEIEARSFWKPVHLQKPYVNCFNSTQKVAENLWQRIITLPCSTGIENNQLDKVRDVVLKSVLTNV